MKKDNVLLSIIIPAYNSEKYICNLLNELKNQINNNVEVIIVENGSTDNTYQIIKDYIKDTKMMRLCKSEKGVSIARNEGIKKARGEYIMFVDSDDYLLDNAINIILEDLQKQKDIYIYGFAKSKSLNNDHFMNQIRYNFFPKNKYDLINWIMTKPTLRGSAWSKVYRKEIIQKNGIYFREDLKYSEDSEFLLRYLKMINSYIVSNEVIYKYYLSPNSAMRKINSERTDNYLKSLQYTINEFSNDKNVNKLNTYILTHLNIIMVHDIFIYRNKLSFKHDVKLFKTIYNNSIFQEYLKNTNISNFLEKELLVEFFLKLKLNYISYLLCYIKSYINQK